MSKVAKCSFDDHIDNHLNGREQCLRYSLRVLILTGMFLQRVNIHTRMHRMSQIWDRYDMQLRKFGRN